jgi:hypothetical protein
MSGSTQANHKAAIRSVISSHQEQLNTSANPRLKGVTERKCAADMRDQIEAILRLLGPASVRPY